MWIRSTTEWYFPLDHAGELQFAVSPVSATLPVARFVEAGVALDVSAARGSTTSSAIGPEVRVVLPRAVLGTDVQRFMNEPVSRLRVFFTTAF
ncbi:MAG TPA: hypothetical protein VJU87_06785 [Gemmatimonadaceae bacterium]|nr:hypothetical protein [Gemmatimonadaceae bacterium]